MLERLLPFILTLLVGLLLGNLGSMWPRFDLPDEVKWPRPYERRQAKQSSNGARALSVKRGWAVIHSMPTPTYTGTTSYGFHIVRVRVMLDASGRVTTATVLSGVPEPLRKDAAKAATKIEFTPARKNGQPVSISTVVQYVFAGRGFRQSAYPVDDSLTISEAGEDWHVHYE